MVNNELQSRDNMPELELWLTGRRVAIDCLLLGRVIGLRRIFCHWDSGTVDRCGCVLLAAGQSLALRHEFIDREVFRLLPSEADQESECNLKL